MVRFRVQRQRSAVDQLHAIQKKKIQNATKTRIILTPRVHVMRAVRQFYRLCEVIIGRQRRGVGLLRKKKVGDVRDLNPRRTRTPKEEVAARLPGNPSTKRISLGGASFAAATAFFCSPASFFAAWLFFSETCDSAFLFWRIIGSRLAESKVPSRFAEASLLEVA